MCACVCVCLFSSVVAFCVGWEVEKKVDRAYLSLQQQSVEIENISPSIQTTTDGGCVFSPKTTALRVGVDRMIWARGGGGGLWKNISQTSQAKTEARLLA